MYIVFGILLIPFLIGFFKEFTSVILSFFKNRQLYLHFLYGFGGYMLLYVILLRKRMRFWETLSHELTHAVFAVLFFKKVGAILATHDEGGVTVYSAKNSNFIIRLTPYFFPLFLVLLLVLGVLTNGMVFHNFQIILGVVAAFQFCTILRDLRPYQTDLQAQGLFFSYIFIFLMNMIVISCVIISLQLGWRECGQFFQKGFSHTIGLLERVFYAIKANKFFS